MKKAFLSIGTLVLLLLLLPSISSALDVVSEGKDWEYTLSVGYQLHTKDVVEDAFSAGLRAQKRVAYPFLLGIGIQAAYFQDILHAELNVPLSCRIGLGPIKADAMLIPGAAYAYNFDNGNDKFMGSITPGIEFKKFVKKGTSVGIGFYYSIYTYSELNNFRFSFVIGF
jgi:hypothetical protein